jgi:hypothetical protein
MEDRELAPRPGDGDVGRDLDRSARPDAGRRHVVDAVVAACLALVAALASFQGQGRVDPVLVGPDGWDIWFDADVPAVYENMTQRHSDHVRTKDHPLFPLLIFPVVKLARLVVSPAVAVRWLVAAVVGLNLGLLFVVLRLLGVGRPAALAFAALAATTATSMFWSVVPETYQFGALSVLLAVTLAAMKRRLAPAWYVAVGALTMSFTITNGLAGLAVIISRFCWGRALTAIAASVAAVTVLWGVQKHVFPTATFFLGDPLRTQFIMPYESHPAHVLRAFFAHSVVMPVLGTLEVPWWIPQLSVQSSPIGAGGWWAMALVAGWWSLLGAGLLGLAATRQHRAARFVLVAVILGQLALHLLFGRETFLYAAHFTPLLVIVAAFSVFTPLRATAAALALVLAIGLAVHNLHQLGVAFDRVREHVTPRILTRAAMRARPADAWPRGTGHVLLGWPGAPAEQKAYHEPGGSLSPGVGTFGVAVWVADARGEVIATGDTIATNVIRQRFAAASGSGLPSVVTETPFYRAAWSSPMPGRWVLALTPHPPATPILVVRSVGPAGGRLTSLRWSGGRLTIGDGWSLTVAPPPRAVHLGDERDPGWKTSRSGQTGARSEDGWAFARLELDRSARVVVTLDAASGGGSDRPGPAADAPLRLEIPDDDFVRSLQAQVAHIQMGRVGGESRPGDFSYPAPWPRDAAYSAVALARVGRIDDGRALAAVLAERDFFGGFGPEADAPGLALWALEEIGSMLDSRDYDAWLWPHARRKAEQILSMLTTTRALRRPAEEPIMPGYRRHPDLTLVAESSSDGLIRGRVDWERPALYVSAISYRGLLDAARLADRLAERADAARWRTAAEGLRGAWVRGLAAARETDDQHTFSGGLWPSAIATAATDAYRRTLDQRFLARRDRDGGYRTTVRSTHVEVAEAHQWLFLARADRVWSTLRWLWTNQASPGLYTWWRDAGQDTADPFHRWDHVRGWVRPPHLTPDAWTAAEVLLLQLDMLGYADDAPEPSIVIGGGVPRSWLDRPLSARGIHTRLGAIDWTWDTRNVEVVIRGRPVRVRLGDAFGADAVLRARFEGR